MLGQLRDLTLPRRFGAVGFIAFSIAGGIAGLAIGLHVEPRTAWFAVIELGIPAGIAGGILGLLVGAAAVAWRGLTEGRRRRS